MHQGGHLQGREQPIAAHAVVSGQDVARLFATQTGAELLHGGIDMLVADGGALQDPTGVAPGPLETQVGHHRGNDPVGRQLARLPQGRTPEIEDLVAIHHTPPAIHGQHPVGVAIEGEAHGGSGLEHRAPQGFEMGAAATLIDSATIGLPMEHQGLGPEGPEHGLAAGGGRPPAQIQHHAAALEPRFADAGDQAGGVGVQQIGARMGRALRHQGHHLRLTAEPRLNRLLGRAVELGARGSEDLDSVVVGGVVAGRHHQASRRPAAADGARHRRGGAETQLPDLATGRGQTGGESRHQHRATGAGIGADHHRPLRGQHPPAPIAHLQGQSRGDGSTDPATDAIGAEGGMGPIEGGTDRGGDPLLKRRRGTGRRRGGKSGRRLGHGAACGNRRSGYVP